MIAADLKRNEGDQRAGFDVIMFSNEDLTAEDETAIAQDLQTQLPYDGESYVNENYYNNETTLKAVANGKKLRFVYAPRHANVPADLVKKQKEWLENQNADTTVTLRSPEDVEAMTHFRILLNDGELNDPNTRFNNTYSRKVEDYKVKDDRPVDDFVPVVCVRDDGRLSRSNTDLGVIYASRAIIVSNLS